MKKKMLNEIFLKDSASKLLVAFFSLYLLFFGMEAVLPGVVTSVFNIDILLAGFALVLLFLLFYPFSSPNNFSPKSKLLFNGYFFAVFSFLLLILFFVLFRASLPEAFIYLALAGVVFKGLWHLSE